MLVVGALLVTRSFGPSPPPDARTQACFWGLLLPASLCTLGVLLRLSLHLALLHVYPTPSYFLGLCADLRIACALVRF